LEFGSDEKSPSPIKTEKILLSIGDPELQADLLPVPPEGETDGLSSRFVGKYEKLGTVQEYAGTMTAEIEGNSFYASVAPPTQRRDTDLASCRSVNSGRNFLQVVSKMDASAVSG